MFVCLSDHEEQEEMQSHTDILTFLFTAGELSSFHRYTVLVTTVASPDWHHLAELSRHLHHRSVTQLLLDKITTPSYTPSPPPTSLVPPTSTNHDPPMGVIQWLSCISLLVGAPLPSGGPLIDLLTKDESVPSEGGGWPGRRWGEETCVLLWVGIRPSGAFFTLIGTTPEPHTKSITSGVVGTQCGRASRNQKKRAGGSGFLWESWTTDFPEWRNKREEKRPGGDKGKILCFCLGKRTGHRSSQGLLL